VSLRARDDSLYRIYKINKNDVSSYDYLHWPFNPGAYADSAGKAVADGRSDNVLIYRRLSGYTETMPEDTAPLKA
ncbi:MAG: hypothetical protein IPG02_15860, partial [Ignavibacteria bacterium]|nr:hypothetical protein [Ignavibacteria bacterium]